MRIAGNATNIKANHPHGWRCYFSGENSTEIPLRDWSISGMVNPENFIPGFSADKDRHGLVAWIDCFGSCTIENEVLRINLQKPIAPKAQQ